MVGNNWTVTMHTVYLGFKHKSETLLLLQDARRV